MSMIVNFFNSNIFNVFSLAISILGIFFSVFFYFKCKKVKIPVYMIRTINLVRENISKIESLEILFANKKIKNLSISKIAIWNEGRETIDIKDVVKHNPLRLRISKDFVFLDAKLVYENKPANGFEISISNDKKYVDIQFEYFDFEDGIVLELYHTGKSSNDIILEGQIKSVKEIKYKEPSLFPYIVSTILPFKRKKARFILGITFIILGIFLEIISLINAFSDSTVFLEVDSNLERILGIVFFCICGILYFLIGFGVVRRRIPKGFDVFDNEF